MKILFTLLSIQTNIVGQNFYLDSAKRLINEILEQTNHDVLLSTNQPNHFDDLLSERCFVRNNIRKDSVLNFGNEFNFNLKHHAFIDIPNIYDYIIYLDSDIKLYQWTQDSDSFMQNIMSQHEFGADRTNCTLASQVNELADTGSCLFKHKIYAYDILSLCESDHDILQSQLPSEHFLILRNTPEKIQKFQERWSELNSILQNKNGGYGAWGDGFEIGLSARYAGFHDIFPTSPFYWKDTLGFQFNGNKY